MQQKASLSASFTFLLYAQALRKTQMCSQFKPSQISNIETCSYPPSISKFVIYNYQNQDYDKHQFQQMKSEMYLVPIQESIRPRNETSEKKKLIALIKKQKDKELKLNGYKKKKKMVGYSEGEWTLRQLKLYHRYLSTHKNQFTDPQLRKRNKVFIKLADFIGSRTPDQCRSHHQKATCKFPDFEVLLTNYETRIFHLSKLYDDMNQASIREREKSEQKRIRQEENQFLMRNNLLEEERAKFKEQKQVKQEENENQQLLKPEDIKVDKTTGEVVTKDYFRYWIERGGALVGVEIDECAIQIFK